MKDMLLAINAAKNVIANLQYRTRNQVLEKMAEEILAHKNEILDANNIDVSNAKNLSAAMLERLKLDSKKIEAMAVALREIALLPNPLGRILNGWENYNGLEIRKISVPIGVIAMIYESRPNVTSDSAALCFKSGNVCILKGGKEALHSNKAILRCLHNVLESYNLPKAAISFVETKVAVESLLKEDKYIDLVIPRGGENLINFVVQNSTIPVIKHDKGVCHLYLHFDAPSYAIAIAINAKLQKPSACNSIETILVHKDCALLSDLIAMLKQHNVAIKAFGALAESYGLPKAEESDFYTEYNANTLNLALVDSLDSAINHINKYGSHHSDSIITQDYSASQRFLNEVDSACVYVNATTRFSDGGEFGFGAEIGISTSKLHARGPMGIDSLTTYKYQICGNGQIREI